LLLDPTPLVLSHQSLNLRATDSTSNKNSILVHTSLSSPRTPSPVFTVETISLIDTGSSAYAFADDESIARKYGAMKKRLAHPKPLRLADGVPSSFVTHYFVSRMTIGYHTELTLFYITNLSPRTPIILGLPWLRKHNPVLDFLNLRVVFNSPHCSHYCLPWGAEPAKRVAPIGSSATPRVQHRQPTVEDGDDHDDVLLQTDIVEDWTIDAKTTPPPPVPPCLKHPTPPLTPPPSPPTKRVRFCLPAVEDGDDHDDVPLQTDITKDWTIDTKTPPPPVPPCVKGSTPPLMPPPSPPTSFQVREGPVRHPLHRLMPFARPGAPRTALTSAGPDTRAIETSSPARPTSHPLPARLVQGRRLPPATPSRPSCASPSDTQSVERPNTDDIRCVRAPNFTQFCKQKGVRVMRIHMAELNRVFEQEENRQLFDELPMMPIALPPLSEESYRRLVEGDYTLDEAKKVLPQYFHDFLKQNLDSHPELLRRKIVDEDVQKFLKDKAPITENDVFKQLPREFHHHVEHFLTKNAEALPPHRPWDHKIEIMPGKQAPYHKNRPLSPAELRCVKKWIDEMLDKGFIRESTSPAAAPLLLAAKPGGGVRICHDYRGLNQVTIKNRYPIPLIRETLDALCGAKFYTKLDVIAAFNRIRIAEGHEWLTAFITRFGLFEMLVTPFGLCNAPATFQNYINHVLHDALDDYCTAYLDDVLVFSKTRAEHTRHVDEVIRRLGTAGLQIDINKSEFYTTKTKYLGLIISTEGMTMDPDKVEAIQIWKDPTSVKELQQFLGFANFYRRFIEGYSSIIEPMTRLLKNGSPWTWGPEQAATFQKLKTAFSTAPVLAYYDYSKKTVVETDASNWASGGVLYQQDDEGKLRAVAFFSSKHTAPECNYEIYDKELLAIVKALEEWRPELQGTEEPFEIVTDHKNLQTFMTTKQLNQRQVRWAEFLSQFNFIITYRPGSKATVPDALSRLPGVKPTGANDERLRHRQQVLLPPEKVHPTILEELLQGSRQEGDHEFLAVVDPEPEKKSIDELIRQGYAEDSLAQQMLAALRERSDSKKDRTTRRWPKAIRKLLRCDKSECFIVDGLIYYRNRLFVPAAPELRLEVAHRTHSAGPAGHPGRVKTLDLLNRTYWWPGMSQFIATFVRDCALCFRTKTPRSAPPGFLKPLELPERPWTDISIDHVVDLPDCRRNGKVYRHILVVVDRLTKMRHFIAVTSLDTDELVEAFTHHVYRLHGAPNTIISDRGSSFVSDFWRRLSQRLRVTLRPSSAFHPETDGQTEIINAAMNKYLRGYVSFTQDDWVDWLPLAEFATNNQVNETTGISPFFANYGYNPHLGIEPAGPRPSVLSAHAKKEYLRADAIAGRFERILTQLKALSRISQQRYEDNANTKRDEGSIFKVHDMVMVSLENMKTNRPKKKWDDNWDGPFPVLAVYKGAVVIDLPDHIRVNKSFHTSKVRLWTPEKIPGQARLNMEERRNVVGRVAQRDDHGNIEDRWEFERIVDVHDKYLDKHGLTYKIKWKHYKEMTWEPEENLKGCDRALLRFHEQNPEKPGPPAWVEKTPAPKRPRGPRKH